MHEIQNCMQAVTLNSELVCMAYHIYKIIVVCPSVRYGRSVEMIRPRDTRCSISGYQLLEARARRFLCVSVIELATDKNTSVLDGLYKNQATMGTYIQWPADS